MEEREAKMKKNITNHALMRYCSRVCKGHVINDRTWEQWKKNHASEIAEIERQLKEEMHKAVFITNAAYDGNRKADFYINEEKLMTYVVVGENLVTCYQIDYGLDEIGNRAILKVFLDNLERSLEAEENYENATKENREKSIAELSIVEAEIKELNAKLERARGQKNKLDQEIKNIDLAHKELFEIIATSKEKIVRSKLAM